MCYTTRVERWGYTAVLTIYKDCPPLVKTGHLKSLRHTVSVKGLTAVKITVSRTFKDTWEMKPRVFFHYTHTRWKYTPQSLLICQCWCSFECWCVCSANVRDSAKIKGLLVRVEHHILNNPSQTFFMFTGLWQTKNCNNLQTKSIIYKTTFYLQINLAINILKCAKI